MLKYFISLLLFLPFVLFAQDPACTPVVTATASQNNICAGTTVTFHAAVANDGTNGVYKWKKNDKDVGATNNADFATTDLHDGDVVTCTYNCKTKCGVDTMVVSKPITMQVLNDITPVITIANNDTLICEGELTVFTSQATYGNAVPSYQWLVNGEPVGTNSPSYSTTTLTNGSKVECVLTASTPSCPGTRSATSQMTIYVYPMIHPTIKIAPSKTDICRGENVLFTATANGGAFPAFTWEVNGVPTGAVGPSLNTSTLKNGDSVSCIITIDQDSRCHTTTSAPSNGVVIHVRDFADPAVTIAAPTLEVCAGTAIMFTATTQNPGTYTSYQWLVNGRMTGKNAPTFSNDQFGDGDKVSCTLSTDIPGCSFVANVSSNIEAVTVKAAPVITFTSPEVSVVTGDAAQLDATVTGNAASFVWNPAGALLTPQSLTSSTIPLVHDTSFMLTVVDTNGCTARKEVAVKVLRRLYMPSAFTPNKDGRNDVFAIPPGTSLGLQEFAIFDRWSTVVFRTTDSTKGWDGTYKGRNVDTGTFVYLIQGTVLGKQVVMKGTVILIR